MKKQTIKQQNNFGWIKFAVILAIMIILFGVGAKFDLEICLAFNDNIRNDTLGRVVTAILAWICLSGGLFFGWCFFFDGIKNWKQNKVLMTLGLIFVFIFMAFFMYFNYDDIHPELLKAYGSSTAATKGARWTFIIMGTISLLGTALFAKWATKQVEVKLMLKVAFIAMCAGLLIMGLKEFLKILWSRPRPSWILGEGGVAAYKPVWEVQPFMCFRAPDLNYRDQLKSFPSGHTSAGMAGVATAVMFNCLPIVKNKKYKNLIFFVSIGLVVLIQFNRMIACCHFLTDVTFAFITGIIISFFAPWFLKIKSKKQTKTQIEIKRK